MKIAEANKNLLKAEVVKAVKAWLASKPKPDTVATGPTTSVGGPDLGTPEVKAISKAVHAYAGAKLLDLSRNPESRRLVDIWLMDHTILQVDTQTGEIQEFSELSDD
jgi:hypothetical protein